MSSAPFSFIFQEEEPSATFPFENDSLPLDLSVEEGGLEEEIFLLAEVLGPVDLAGMELGFSWEDKPEAIFETMCLSLYLLS